MDDTADRPEGDAASDGFKSAFVAALNHYIHDHLGVAMDRPCKPSAELLKEWNWRPVPKELPWEPSSVNVARRLSKALRRNASLNVMVASGYYDMATPFFDAENTHIVIPSPWLASHRISKCADPAGGDPWHARFQSRSFRSFCSQR